MRGMPKNIGPLHFIGIGGIGMSGIAEILCSLGYTVQGSDQAENANVKRLRAAGIDIKIGHDAANLGTKTGGALAAVVISSAIKPGNPELSAAREQGIPVIRRAEMLAELMRLKWAVAISGTHGKTTTTSMVGQMLETAGFDPTVINGGIVHAYGANVRLGQSDIMVVEADESDGTFTRLPASVVVVTNMDPEHLDHYGTFENAKAAYRQFIHNLPFYGYAVLCIDHPEVQALIPSVNDRRIITYGFSPQADVRADNVRSDAKGSVFDVTFSGRVTGGEDVILKDVHLPMLGRHNVQNSLASLAIAQEAGVAPSLMKKGLSQFAGVKRRFTKTGEIGGITVIDDYAHHPVEIEVVLKTARTAVAEKQGRVIAVMQPHRYTRLHDLFDDFCKCFNEADTVIIADVYEAGEEPIEGAHKDALVEGVRAHGHRDVSALPNKEALAEILAVKARPEDYIICMGAGDITAWAYALPAELERHLAKAKGNAA
ncbi:MAG: UDP-N-acetylmuramate--L-alanine ligase [Alphaproteobacteria bacterium]|nr:UDP-N-acetylmuramate--L-alanine ligase [Alphaproteobacteria bacterium]